MSRIFENDPELEHNLLELNNEGHLEKIVEILQKPADARTKLELKNLYILLKKVDFLKDFWVSMPPHVCLALLKSLKYDYASKGQIVFNYGDQKKYFYLILKGSVFVVIPNKEKLEISVEVPSPLDIDVSEEPSPTPSLLNDISFVSKVNKDIAGRKSDLVAKEDRLTKKKSSKKGSLLRPTTTSAHANRPKTLLIKNDSKDHPFLRRSSMSLSVPNGPMTPDELAFFHPNNTLINTLKEKDYFGEIALEFNIKRTATVIAREPCQFMILDAKAYNSIIGKYQNELQKDMLKFFKMTSLTKDWPNSSLVGLMRHSKIVQLPLNYVIYKFGDPINSIYFIKRGEVEIIKEAEVDSESIDYVINTKKRGSLSIDKVNLIDMNTTWKKKHREARRKQIRIAILSQHQSFGEEEYVERRETRQSKAVVKSDSAEIIIVPFTKIVENLKDPEQFRNLLAGKDVKAKWRQTFENEMLETSKVQNTWKEELIRRKNETENLSYIQIGNMTGVKKMTPRDTRFTTTGSDAPITPIGTVNRLMQQELDKKYPFKDFIKSSSSKQVSRNIKTTYSPRIGKSPELFKNVIAKAFQTDGQQSKVVSPKSSWKDSNPTSLELNKESLHLAKSCSVSGLLTPSESPEMLSAFLKSSYPTKKRNLIHLQSSLISSNSPSPSPYDSNQTDVIPQNEKSSKNLFTPSVLYSDFISKQKTIQELHNTRPSLSERLGLKKLFIEKSPSPSSNRSPIQFYINTPKGESSKQIKPVNKDVSETLATVLSSKIKVNASSPRIITKIKSQMNSPQNSSSGIMSGLIISQKPIEISKLNKFIHPQMRRYKNRSTTAMAKELISPL